MKKLKLPYYLSLVFITILYYSCSKSNIGKQDYTVLQLQPDSSMVQEEVCAVLTKENELVVAWVDRKAGTDEKFISYTASYDGKQKWYPVTTYNPKDYIWTGNPALAVDDNGIIYLIAMSNNYDGKNLPTNGIFELSQSNDGGKSWTEWKTIVKNSAEFKDLADKPSLIARGDGELYLSYINFNSDKSNMLNSKGDVILLKSKDKGETWQDRIIIDNKRGWKPSSMIKTMTSGIADFGEQGPSLSFFKNKIILSFGSYQNNGIWFASSDDDGKTFSVNKISDLEIKTPVTKLYTNNSDLILSVVYEAHDIGNIFYLKSNDEGKTFIKERLSKEGSIATGSISADNQLYFIWNEKNDDSVNTKYMTVKGGNELVKSFYDGKKLNPGFFIGAYQELLVDKDNKIHVLWIDWSIKGGKLVYSQIP